MIKFLLQLGVAAGLGYYAGTYAEMHALYDGPPRDIVAAFVLPFLLYRAVAHFAGPVVGRLAVLALLVVALRLAGLAFVGDVLSFSDFEWLALGMLALLAIVLPGKSSYGKLQTGASKAAIASGEEWAWEGRRFALHIDFKAATVRVIARKPLRYWRSGGDPKAPWRTARRFDDTWPLHQFELGEIFQRMKSSFTPNTASTWVNGQLISVSLPGGTSNSYPSGVTDITLKHRGAHEAPCDRAGLKVADGGPEKVTLCIEGVRNHEIEQFKTQWKSIAARVEAARSAFNGEIEARAQALRQQERERKAALAAQAEAAEKERLAALHSQVEAHITALLDEAGMRGDFRAGTHKEGRLNWLVAADRDGRGLVIGDAGNWQGSFAGAGARIVAGKERCLEIELQDSAYEREHLKKHRLRVMHGAGEDTLQEWCDRVTILGKGTAAS